MQHRNILAGFPMSRDWRVFLKCQDLPFRSKLQQAFWSTQDPATAADKQLQTRGLFTTPRETDTLVCLSTSRKKFVKVMQPLDTAQLLAKSLFPRVHIVLLQLRRCRYQKNSRDRALTTVSLDRMEVD